MLDFVNFILGAVKPFFNDLIKNITGVMILKIKIILQSIGILKNPSKDITKTKTPNPKPSLTTFLSILSSIFKKYVAAKPNPQIYTKNNIIVKISILQNKQLRYLKLSLKKLH